MYLLHRILTGTTVMLVVLLNTAGCRAPDDQELIVGGCTTAFIHQVQQGSPTVIDVTASGCQTITNPTGRVAFAVWGLMPSGTRTVRIRLDGPRSPVTVMSRADLEHHFGPAPQRDDTGSYTGLLWLLLPAAPVVVGLVALTIARSAARSGVIIVLFRR